MLYIWIEFTTINAGGARQIVVEIEDATHDILARIPAGSTQDANTARHYFYGPGMADLTEFRDVSTDWLSTPIPPTLVLPERTNIHIYDENAISGQDDMIIHMDIGRRLVG